MRTLLVGIAVVVLASSAASAQELERRPVRPAPVAVAAIRGNGHAETWDGRVFFVTRNVGGPVGWVALVARPEAFTVDAAGLPVFSFSVPVTVELNGASGMGNHNSLALVAEPSFPENPFRSTSDGTPSAGGAFECYELVVFCPNDRQLGQRRARVVVSNPRTPLAAIHEARLLTPWTPLTGPQGGALRGIEPTLTFDGRLMIWNGNPANDGSISILMYSWNASPAALAGWSTPRCIADMNAIDGATIVAGIPFVERFPLGRRPLASADGTPYPQGSIIKGAYPWVSHDGTEVFYQATIADSGARRASTSVLGRATGWVARNIDGPINPDRSETSRLFFSSPGLKTGFWTPYRELRGVPIPYSVQRPVYSLFGSNTANYCEVSLEDHEDGDYVAVYRMNELVGHDFRLDPSRTPDTSGNLNTGVLKGARFPQDALGGDENRGAVGESILFRDGDAVVVKNAPTLTTPSVTVQLFAQRMVADGTERPLARKDGAWSLVLEPDGRVRASVRVGGIERAAPPAGPLATGEWVNVAFTYDGRRLTTFLAGSIATVASFATGPIDPSTGELVLGPGSATVPGVKLVLGLDEVLVSRVARTPLEVARAAYYDARPKAPTARMAVPLGLDARDLRIPGPPTADAAELGRRLFSEKKLSGDATMSCATCHDPARSFTDGRAIAVGHGGKLLTRNTPTIFNRAFSTLQFFDGRARSLEEQALVPIANPDEMNAVPADVAKTLDADPVYGALFRKAFGTGATPTTIGRALAAFERTALAGDSSVDRFEDGDKSALSASEIRGRLIFHGRGRCVACHTRSNYTDEMFHNTAATDGRDGGRGLITGRRADRGAFKTPTLRRVALTAPYLHDGSAATLEDVIELYDRGGRTATDRDREIRPLGLTPREKADLAAFLRAL